jgi:hypothetical protein
MFEWFRGKKKEPIVPKPSITPRIQEEMERIDAVYDSMHESLRAIATFYEKGEEICVDIPYDNNFPRDMSKNISSMQDALGFMIRSLKESIKPPTERNDVARAFASYDVGRISDLPDIVEELIGRMSDHIQALDAEKSEPLAKYIDEADAGQKKLAAAVTAMRGHGINF